VSSTPSNEHSASDAASLRQRFLNGDFTAGTQAFTRPTPRREPETIVLDESEEGEDAGKIREEDLPKPIQVGNCLFQCQVPSVNAEYSFPDDAAGKRMLKRYLFNRDHHDVYGDADNAANTQLPAANK